MNPLWVRVRADPANVRDVRVRLRAWLTGVVDDPDIAEDILLAVSEAVENVVDHAFTGAVQGTVTLHARHEATPPPSIVVVVSDDGNWQAPHDPGYRGRGLELIARLCSSYELDAETGGTRVTMRRLL